MKIPFRQGIVQYQTDANKNQLFLSATGQSVSLIVGSTPTIINFAQNTANYLYTEGQTVPNAWAGPFLPGTTYWLYWDLSIRTGARSFGSTTIAPVIGPKAPSNPVNGTHWYDTINSRMNQWNGIVWVNVIRAFAAKYVVGASFVSLVTGNTNQTGSANYAGTQVSDYSPCASGALLFDPMGKPLITSNNTFFTSETGAAVSGLASAVNFAAITVEATAQQPIPAFSFVYFSAFNEISLANQRTADNGPFGMVQINMVQGVTSNVVTTGIVTNLEWNWPTVNALVYIAADGTATTTQAYGGQTSVGYVINPNSILLHQLFTVGVSNGGGSTSACASSFVAPPNQNAPIVRVGPPALSVPGILTTDMAATCVITNAAANTPVSLTISAVNGSNPPVVVLQVPSSAGVLTDANGVWSSSSQLGQAGYISAQKYAGQVLVWAVTVNNLAGTAVTLQQGVMVQDVRSTQFVWGQNATPEAPDFIGWDEKGFTNSYITTSAFTPSYATILNAAPNSNVSFAATLSIYGPTTSTFTAGSGLPAAASQTITADQYGNAIFQLNALVTLASTAPVTPAADAQSQLLYPLLAAAETLHPNGQYAYLQIQVHYTNWLGQAEIATIGDEVLLTVPAAPNPVINGTAPA